MHLTLTVKALGLFGWHYIVPSLGPLGIEKLKEPDQSIYEFKLYKICTDVVYCYPSERHLTSIMNCFLKSSFIKHYLFAKVGLTTHLILNWYSLNPGIDISTVTFLFLVN